MPIGLNIKEAKKSAVRRLSYLPRLGVTVDFAGKKFEYRYAPISELLYNLCHDGFSSENFKRIVVSQFSETNLETKDFQELVAEVEKVKEAAESTATTEKPAAKGEAE